MKYKILTSAIFQVFIFIFATALVAWCGLRVNQSANGAVQSFPFWVQVFYVDAIVSAIAFGSIFLFEGIETIVYAVKGEIKK